MPCTCQAPVLVSRLLVEQALAGIASDEESDADEQLQASKKTHVQEQEAIRKAFKKVRGECVRCVMTANEQIWCVCYGSYIDVHVARLQMRWTTRHSSPRKDRPIKWMRKLWHVFVLSLMWAWHDACHHVVVLFRILQW